MGKQGFEMAARVCRRRHFMDEIPSCLAEMFIFADKSALYRLVIKNRRQLRWSLFKTLIEIIKNKLTITRSLKIKNKLLCFLFFFFLFVSFVFVCLFFNANIFFIGGVGAQISHYIGTLYRLSHEQIKRWGNLTALNFLSGCKNREKHSSWHNLSFNFVKRILVLSAGAYRPDRHLRINC